MARTLDELKADLAAKIRELRIARGVTQEQLALQADVDRTYVSQVERSVGNPSLLVLAKLAEVFEVDVAVLLEPGAARKDVRRVRRES